jgi:hypothetical protein
MASNFHWEFWSAKIFYIPVIFFYISLMLKYKISVKAIAYVNPSFPFGGMAFDSKYDILKKFFHYPEFVAQTILIQSNNRNIDLIKNKITELRLNYPIVAKPDKAHRGNGFRILRSEIDLKKYLVDCPRDFLLQEYIAYPKEYGIFWIRIPNSKGKITSITRKILPELIGNGKSTLKELIFSDPRAKFLAKTYFEKNSERLNWILSKEDSFKISNAGNHCQGAIFEDGALDIKGKTLNKLIEISASVSGFDFGRMDIKFKDEESLSNGQNFKILEVNGSEAESTHIYDRKYSILYAYKTLYSQWDSLFKIASINKANGIQAMSYFDFFKNYFLFFKDGNPEISAD